MIFSKLRGRTGHAAGVRQSALSPRRNAEPFTCASSLSIIAAIGSRARDFTVSSILRIRSLRCFPANELIR